MSRSVGSSGPVAVVTVSAARVGRHGCLPTHCSRHGLPAVRQQDFVLQSKPRLGGTDVRGWPLCGRCVRARVCWLAVASVLFFGGLAVFAGSLIAAAASDGPWLAGLAAAGFVLMPLAAVPFALGSLPRLIRARTSSDGESVVISRPSRAFTAQLPAAE